MNKTDTFLQTIQRKFAGNKRISSSLVTLSSAAILAIYAAGYEQTKAAADRFNEQSALRLASGPSGSSVEQTSSVPTADSTETRLPVADTIARYSTAASTDRHVGTGNSDAASTIVAVNSGPPNDAPASAIASLESPLLPISKPEVTPIHEPVAVVTEARAVELPVPVVAPVAVPAPAPRQNLYKDGTFQGWGSSRHGDIQVSVVIQDGRIASAAISQCLTRYPCSWIAQLPGQVVSRQTPTVDYVSGATQSVNAYYSAVVEALSRAK